MTDQSTIGITQLLRRATFSVFACAVVAGSIIFYLFSHAASMRHIADEAGALMTAATAVRNYTVDKITPLIERTIDGKFAPETVPSFAAQSVFKRLSGDLHNYNYREVSRNPTNIGDLATPFESDLISKFEQDKGLAELSAVRRVGDDSHFYLARPIVMEHPNCLSCHSTPDVAPVSMIEAYGSQNGFGWQLNSVVAIQILTIPVNDELIVTYELVAIFFVILLIFFVGVFLAVMLPLHRNLILPLRQLANIAERSSLRDD
jgi:protein-histidine pros-kinase